MAAKRILVVDDSCMYQRLLSDVINAHPNLEVVGVAENGQRALELISSLKPDLVTLDILMPEMDGIQTLIKIGKNSPDVRTIMVSSLTSEGSDAALDALALGANEFVAKPTASGGVKQIHQALSDDLLPKIEALCAIDKVAKKVEVGIDHKRDRSMKSRLGKVNVMNNARPEVVLIGISTGGPDALAKLLGQLPADFEVPVVIVQHMPAEFTLKLALRLDAISELCVKEAEIGDVLRPGCVYVAPGDYHMLLERRAQDVIIKLNQDPHENSCRPAVDPLFRSAAAIYGNRCLGVIMTGMGQDGLKGSEALYSAGSSIIVQDEESSIVWGMPKLVAMAGLADVPVPLNQMANRILERVRCANGKRGVVVTGVRNAANNASHGQSTRGGEVS